MGAGFAFIEYKTPMQAAAAVKNLDNHALDKSHVFRVNHYEDFAVADKYPDEYEEPTDTPFDEIVRCFRLRLVLLLTSCRRRTFTRGCSTHKVATSLPFATAMTQRSCGTASEMRRLRATASALYVSFRNG